MSFTKIPVLLQLLSMKKLMILSTAFFCLSTMKFFLLRLDRFVQFLYTSSVIISRNSCFRISAWQSARICSHCRSRRGPNLFALKVLSLPCAWLASRQTTGLHVLSWLTDDDRQDDRPSPSEWSARLRHDWGVSDRWWYRRSRSLRGTVARSRTPGWTRHKPLWWSGRWAHNLWRSSYCPEDPATQRQCAWLWSTTSRKRKVKDRKKCRKLKVMKRGKVR